MLRWSNVRSVTRFSQRRTYTTANTSPKSAAVEKNSENVNDKQTRADTSSAEQSKLVNAAFASLQQISFKSKFRKSSLVEVEETLNSAQDIDSLLSIANEPFIAKRNALRVVNILSDWVQKGKCSLKDFETDARFTKLCKILGRSSSSGSPAKKETTDLSIVLNVTADDQAAKLITSVDLQQMVKILSSLGSKKRRSLSLLRSLSHNIAKSSERMNIKEAADVLYACATLNFVDDVLIEKTIADVLICLKENEKASVTKSIVNSIGMLRYRHTNLLENLTTWFITNKKLCSAKELLSVLYTLANLNYLPDDFVKFKNILEKTVTIDSMNNKDEWVSAVWSSIVLDQYDEKLLDSVLNPDFLKKLNIKSGTRDIALKLKLLNINGYAKLRGNEYKGHLLDESSSIFNVPLSRSKDEEIFFNSVLETISSIVSVSDYVKTDIDSKMGFVIDAESLLDPQQNFVKLSDTSVENISKVAIMVCSYNDMCRGCSNQPTGITALIHKLTRNMGYKLLCIPYDEYNPRDKLIARVQYLSQKLKLLD